MYVGRIVLYWGWCVCDDDVGSCCGFIGCWLAGLFLFLIFFVF